MGRRWKQFYSAMLAVVAALLATTLGLARPAGQEGLNGQTSRYLGSAFCASCHSEPGNAAFRGSLDHILLDEFSVWTGKGDRHSRAYRSLTEPTGQDMGRRLGVNVTKAEGGCLGCHSAQVEGTKHSIGDAFRKEDGVACEKCHGPSEAWIAPHTQHDWRGKSPAEKAAYGMVDLRDPARQAANCLSCHVGDAKAGKVVTHAMFAVGHPPLPSFDVATFGEQIPRHWRLLREKRPDVEADRFERSRLAIVSAAVALRSELNLVADETRAEAKPIPGRNWPDYARFDCKSCHHELVREPNQPSRRQRQGFAGPPGRPPLASWSGRVVRIAIEGLIHDEAPSLVASMSGHEKALIESTNSRTFGRLPDLGDAAARYASWADELAGRLRTATIDPPAVRALLGRLATEASTTDLDYEAARLFARIAWAFYADLGPDPKYDREISEALVALSRHLDLGLPDHPGSGRPTSGRLGTIEGRLPGTLRAMGAYDPARTRANFKKIADSLGRP